jgi:hypothetical protein
MVTASIMPPSYQIAVRMARAAVLTIGAAVASTRAAIEPPDGRDR